MPAMKGNQPMKDDYVSGLEKRVANKVGDVAAAGRKIAKTGLGMHNMKRLPIRIHKPITSKFPSIGSGF